MPATNLLVLHPRQAHNYNPSFIALQVTHSEVCSAILVFFPAIDVHMSVKAGMQAGMQAIFHPVGGPLEMLYTDTYSCDFNTSFFFRQAFT